MLRAQNVGVLLLTLVLAAACRDQSSDRSPLTEDEMDRELDLALSADSVPATFQDTAIGVQPEAEPESPPEPSPRPVTRQPARSPAPAPAPVAEAREPQRERDVLPPEPRVTTARAAVGTTFAVTLNETLSTETNRVGDMFTATLQSPIRDANGALVVPAGAVVRGRLTQVDKSGHVGETGVLALAFESVSFDGRSLALEGTVVKANPQRKSRSSTQSQVGKAAAGAAAGAVLGRVLGKDTKGTITGAVIGAAAGTAIAMGTADVDVVLPAGSEMVIRLDSALEVRL